MAERQRRDLIAASYEYDAFISYSRKADGQVTAPKLQRLLRRVGRPWFRRGILRVFRDRTNLPMSEDLWKSIENALKRSRYFILMASPAAAESPWVVREVEYWRRSRERSTFLIVHTEGSIVWDENDFDWEHTNALPEVMGGWFTQVPAWGTVVADGTSPARGGDRLRDVARTISAQLYGVDKDQVDGEDERESRRARRTLQGGIIALALLTVVAVAAALISIEQRDEAVAQHREAEEQRRVATGRLLAAEAENLRDTEPATSLAASLAALRIAPTPDVRADLVETLMSTHLVGTAARSGDPELIDLELIIAPNTHTAVTSASRAEAGSAYRYETVVWDTTNSARWARAATLPEQVLPSAPKLAIGADGRTLASVGGDSVALWDLADRSEPRRLGELPTRDAYAIAIGQEDRVLAVAEEDGVLLWQIEDRARPRRLADLPELNQASHLVFSPDGRTLATTRSPAESVERGANDHQATLWDVRDPARPTRPTPVVGHFSDTVYGAAFSPDGTLLATAGEDGTVILWNIADRTSPARLSVLRGHLGWVRTVAFSPQGTRLVSGGDDGDAILWDIADRSSPKRTATLSGHTEAVHTVAFDQGGVGLVTASPDSTMNYWRVADRRRPATTGILSGHRGSVTDLAMSPDSAVAATASTDDTAILWDLATPVSPRHLTGHTDDVLAVDFGRDGGLLVTAGKDRAVILWDVGDPNTPRRIGALPPDSERVNDVALSPDGRTLVTASGWLGVGGHVTVWDIDDPTAPVRASTIGETGTGIEGADAVEFSPDGRILAVGADTLELWDVREPQQPHLLGSSDHVEVPVAFAFRQDGRVLAVASARDGQIADDLGRVNLTSLMLVDITDPARPERLAVAEAGLPEDVAFSPDGRTLITAGSRPVMWDVRDLRRPAQVATLTGHAASATGVVFGADSRTVVTSSVDATAMIWDAGDLPGVISRSTELACAAVGTGFTKEQWADRAPGMPRPLLCL